MKKEKTEIKIVKIKECVPNSWNPNEMNARQFASLKKALEKWKGKMVSGTFKSKMMWYNIFHVTSPAY